ncbi:Uncharacterized protein Adt_33989 [Abeliophyllum distichum]|uniref:Uncharacterized protein n=1 Tax=Abeliophyllum distichum TaxID=126358 RepID=A0ABD1QXT2_9LAMI
METADQCLGYNNQYMNKTDISFQNQGTTIKNLKTQVDQTTIALSPRVLDTLPINAVVNPNESVTSVTIRSDVQLPEIHVNRPVENKENEPSTDEEHVEQTKQTSDNKESSDTPQVKSTIPIKPYEHPIPLSSEITKARVRQAILRLSSFF